MDRLLVLSDSKSPRIKKCLLPGIIYALYKSLSYESEQGQNTVQR